jgi:hypothetical protein
MDIQYEKKNNWMSTRLFWKIPVDGEHSIFLQKPFHQDTAGEPQTADQTPDDVAPEHSTNVVSIRTTKKEKKINNICLRYRTRLRLAFSWAIKGRPSISATRYDSASLDTKIDFFQLDVEAILESHHQTAGLLLARAGDL